MEIVSDGLTLRRWVPADIPALIAAYTDPDLRRWTQLHATDPASARRWLAAQDDGWSGGTRFSFAVTSGTELLGCVAVKSFEGTGAEVGYWTAAPARGRGVAPRAVRALTEWTFTTFPQVERLTLLHRLGNVASCRVAEKAGYAYLETLPAEAPGRQDGHRHGRPRA